MAMVKVKMDTPKGYAIFDEANYDPKVHTILERIEEPAPKPRRQKKSREE